MARTITLPCRSTFASRSAPETKTCRAYDEISMYFGRDLRSFGCSRDGAGAQGVAVCLFVRRARALYGSIHTTASPVSSAVASRRQCARLSFTGSGGGGRAPYAPQTPPFSPHPVRTDPTRPAPGGRSVLRRRIPPAAAAAPASVVVVVAESLPHHSGDGEKGQRVGGCGGTEGPTSPRFTRAVALGTIATPMWFFMIRREITDLVFITGFTIIDH